MSVTSELYAVRFDGASEPPTGWQTWTPRDATAPAFTCRDDALHTQAGPSPGGQGAWTRRIPGIQPGEHYRLTIRYRAEGAHHEHKQIYARLLWLDEQGQRQHHRDQEYFPAPGVTSPSAGFVLPVVEKVHEEGERSF